MSVQHHTPTWCTVHEVSRWIVQSIRIQSSQKHSDIIPSLKQSKLNWVTGSINIPQGGWVCGNPRPFMDPWQNRYHWWIIRWNEKRLNQNTKGNGVGGTTPFPVVWERAAPFISQAIYKFPDRIVITNELYAEMRRDWTNILRGMG